MNLKAPVVPRSSGLMGRGVVRNTRESGPPGGGLLGVGNIQKSSRNLKAELLKAEMLSLAVHNDDDDDNNNVL